MNKPVLNCPPVEELIVKELSEGRGIEAIMERFRNSVIVQALAMRDWNQSQAAVLLKTHRNTIVRWLKDAGITAEEIKKWSESPTSLK